MKKFLLAGVFASVSFTAFAQAPGLSDSDVGTQAPKGASIAQYSDHPAATLNQNAATAKGGKGGSATATGGAGGQGGTGGTSRSVSRGGSATGGTSNSSSQGGTVTNNIASGEGGGGRRSGSVWDNPVSTAYAPSFAGANGCSGRSNSAGGGAAVISLTFGHQGMDDACRLEQARGNPVALALLCIESADIRQAMKDVGTPCPADRGAVVTPVAAAPAPIGIRYQFDWCYTVDAGNVKQRKYCEAHAAS